MWIELSHLESPLGGIVLAVADGALCALDFAESEGAVRSWIEKSYPGARLAPGSGGGQQASEKVRAYFGGELRALEEIPVSLRGTEFQKRVWAALREIGVGRTCSYRDLAKVIGSPTAVRAVGAANGHNPVPLVVPCHRVIASDGTLCGYGGGLWRKEWLLRHEHAWGCSQDSSANPPQAISS